MLITRRLEFKHEVPNRYDLKQLIATFRLNLRGWLQPKVTRFRRNWGFLSAEERALLESRKVFAKAVSRSMY